MTDTPAAPLRVRVRGGTLFCRIVAPLLMLAVRARFLAPQRAHDIACRWVDQHVRVVVSR